MNKSDEPNGQRRLLETLPTSSGNGGITHKVTILKNDEEYSEENYQCNDEKKEKKWKLTYYMICVISGVASFIAIGHFIISLISFSNTSAAVWSAIASIPATFNLHVYVLRYRDCQVRRPDAQIGWYPVIFLGALFTHAGLLGCAIHIAYGIFQNETFEYFSDSSYLAAFWALVNGAFGLSVLVSTLMIYKKLPYYPPWGDIFY